MSRVCQVRLLRCCYAEPALLCSPSHPTIRSIMSQSHGKDADGGADTTDRVWREYNIHDNDDDEGSDDDEAAAAASSFNLFATTDPDDIYETISYPDLLPRQHADCPNPTIALRAHKQYENSTGMAVWKGSEVMAAFLLQHEATMVQNRTICELGAGVGLCGIVASRLGAKSVLMTDGDTTVLENLRHNVDLNSTTTTATIPDDSESHSNTGTCIATNTAAAAISCPQLIWGKECGSNFANAHGHQDVVLATDCVYITKSVRPLLATIHEILEPKSGVFLYVNTCASQCPIEAVFDIAREFGLHCVDTWCDSDDKDDTVYIFRRQE